LSLASSRTSAATSYVMMRSSPGLRSRRPAAAQRRGTYREAVVTCSGQ
jgi:hypothetical protein